MKENATAMILAAFAADALALGAHWIYDQDRIERELGRLTDFRSPPKDSFHPTKTLGDLTHYGDQAMVLLRLISDEGGFNPQRFLKAWQSFFDLYEGYVDQATRQTLRNLNEGKHWSASGSASTDLGGASRIPPLVYWHRRDPQRLIADARVQTAMTHNHPLVVESAVFFADAAATILAGRSPVQALESASARLPAESPLKNWLQKGLDSASLDTRNALAAFGLVCEIDRAFPAVIHLVARYENDLEAALVENVMAGGDSAARGLIAGMLLGAFLGEVALPRRWIAQLKSRDAILSLLQRMDARRKP